MPLMLSRAGQPANAGYRPANAGYRPRSVVTDGEGLYKIIDLRPGSYTVTFTLAGFNTVRREGVELTSAFTATVNAELRVGALEETVTVSGQVSTVDLQNVTQQRVLTRTVMDDVPVGTKTIAAMGALIPGVVANTQDVGAPAGPRARRFRSTTAAAAKSNCCRTG